MAMLDDIRQQYPAYNDMPDQALADALYSKFYADMPRADFNAKVGFVPKDFSARLGEVWANPTPGSVFDIAKKAVGFAQTAKGVSTGEIPAQIDGHSNPELIDRSVDMASVTPLSPAPGGIFGANRTGAPVTIPAPASAPMLQSAKDIGVPIPRYMATDNTAVQRIASSARNVPIAGDPILKSARNVSEGLGAVARNVQDELGAGSPDIAGGVAKDALNAWIKGGSKKPVDASYRVVDNMVDPSARMRLLATADEAEKMLAERRNARIPGDSEAVKIVQDAINAPNGLNYQGLKDLRSFLGERTPTQLMADRINPKEAKRLYGPLTRDLESLVESAGGEPALNAWREANALHALTMEQRKTLTKVVGTKGDAATGEVFNRILGLASSKSRGDVERLSLARVSMGRDAWNEVSSAIVSRLGRDAEGNFSPDRFATAWGQNGAISDAAKARIFDKDHLKALNDIFNVSSAVKEKVSQFANTSKTAPTAVGVGMLTGMFTAPWATIPPIIGTRVLSEMLSRPATAKIVADYVRVAKYATGKPNEAALLAAATKNLTTAAASLSGANDNVRRQEIFPQPIAGRQQ